MLGLKLQDYLRIVDGGGHLQPVANDGRVLQQAVYLGRTVSSHSGDVKLIVGLVEARLLLQNGSPAEASLVYLQYQAFEKVLIGAHREAILGVVVTTVYIVCLLLQGMVAVGFFERVHDLARTRIPESGKGKDGVPKVRGDALVYNGHASRTVDAYVYLQSALHTGINNPPGRQSGSESVSCQMLKFEDSLTGFASAALAHLFIGLMKADGVITISEEILMEEMLLKKSNLPGDGPTIHRHIRQMVRDKDYERWGPRQHFDHAFNVYQRVLDSEEGKEKKLDTLLHMMNLLMRVDSIQPSEQEYIANVAAMFRERYNYEDKNY